MVYETIKGALIDQLGIEADLIKPDAFIEKDLELDSTETVIIALEIKKKFKVDFAFPKKDISIFEICQQVEQLYQKNRTEAKTIGELV